MIIIFEVFPQATVAFHDLLLHRHRPISPIFIYLFIFGKKNADIIFYVEKKLFEASSMSASWVRMLICNDMYYFEMGMSPLQLHVAQRQWKLFRNSWNEMREMVGGAWVYAVKRVLVLLYMIYIARERMLQRSIE